MKYRTTLNSLLLLFYFIPLLAGVFHHHHFDFTFTKVIDTKSNSGIVDLQIQSGTEYTCILHQNITNLQTPILICFNANQLIKDEHPVLNTSKIFFTTNKLHLTDNLRRGPPSLS